jgi:hypothetical protein
MANDPPFNRHLEHSLIQIETTQAALRDCIKRAQELADDSERLIPRHKTVVMGPKPENPAQ